jgi:hypothetical protein
VKESRTILTARCDGCGAEARDEQARGWRAVTVTVSFLQSGEHMRTRSVDLCESCLRAARVPGIDAGAPA